MSQNDSEDYSERIRKVRTAKIQQNSFRLETKCNKNGKKCGVIRKPFSLQTISNAPPTPMTISDRIRTGSTAGLCTWYLEFSMHPVSLCRCVQCRLSLYPMSSVVVSNVVCRCIQCRLSLYPMSSVVVSNVVCRLVRKGYSHIVALLCFSLATIYALKPRPRLIHHRHVSTIFGRLQRQRRFR